MAELQKFPAFMDVKMPWFKFHERMIFELFDEVAPVAARNFRDLCLGDYVGDDARTMRHLCYGNCFFRKEEKDSSYVMLWKLNEGEYVDDLLGSEFPDEPSHLKHDKEGLLSMSIKDQKYGSCRFLITLRADQSLDSSHVIFGRVLHGLPTLRWIGQTCFGSPVHVAHTGIQYRAGYFPPRVYLYTEGVGGGNIGEMIKSVDWDSKFELDDIDFERTVDEPLDDDDNWDTMIPEQTGDADQKRPNTEWEQESELEDWRLEPEAIDWERTIDEPLTGNWDTMIPEQTDISTGDAHRKRPNPEPEQGEQESELEDSRFEPEVIDWEWTMPKPVTGNWDMMIPEQTHRKRPKPESEQGEQESEDCRSKPEKRVIRNRGDL